ncbi:hypothetical protein ODZ83_05990 [Acaricomes phytoseiuli]|uniref:hypothetical protein n=1 Tax=Acaricomes phytoseiuli TaxID=291968 RepID=UPI0012EA1057|nr:hypothetical protein [Acaricomes phytoseiuli]MCW1249742.1 hypothetical protein [Acaricomes phytoseiuli]
MIEQDQFRVGGSVQELLLQHDAPLLILAGGMCCPSCSKSRSISTSGMMLPGSVSMTSGTTMW